MIDLSVAKMSSAPLEGLAHGTKPTVANAIDLLAEAIRVLEV